MGERSILDVCKETIRYPSSNSLSEIKEGASPDTVIVGLLRPPTKTRASSESIASPPPDSDRTKPKIMLTAKTANNNVDAFSSGRDAIASSPTTIKSARNVSVDTRNARQKTTRLVSRFANNPPITDSENELVSVGIVYAVSKNHGGQSPVTHSTNTSITFSVIGLTNSSARSCAASGIRRTSVTIFSAINFFVDGGNARIPGKSLKSLVSA